MARRGLSRLLVYALCQLPPHHPDLEVTFRCSRHDWFAPPYARCVENTYRFAVVVRGLRSVKSPVAGPGYPVRQLRERPPRSHTSTGRWRRGRYKRPVAL